MTYDPQDPNRKARVIKANHLLQNKVGGGSIADDKLSKMQKVIDTVDVDFVPMATDYLAQLAQGLQKAKEGSGDQSVLISGMVDPVMQVKANAAMFGYPLVSQLASVVLDFLESIDSIDSDVLDIVDAHHKTLELIIKNKLSGAGGEYGDKLKAELNDACQRYYTKHR